MHDFDIVSIDDDPIALSVVEKLALSLGCPRVVSCASVARGIAALDAADGRPILLICDINMPDIDGIEFLRILAARPFAGALVICSGADKAVRDAAANLARAYGLDLCGVFEKPLDLKSLAAAIASAKPL
jgi:CheY-like chemotaxis protein